ncbi:MAG: hypothetical protein EOP49_53760, partial [Sphingobacteriales bacterium]
MTSVLYGPLAIGEWATLGDPVGFVAILNKYSIEVMPVDHENWDITLESTLLWGRLFWLLIGAGALFITYRRFKFSSPQGSRKEDKARARKQKVAPSISLRSAQPEIPYFRPAYNFLTALKQWQIITRMCFMHLAKRKAGLPILVLLALVVLVILPFSTKHMDFSMYPQSANIISLLTSPIDQVQSPWMIIPLLLIFYTAELLWRDRETRISNLVAATPVSEFVQFTAKASAIILLLTVGLGLRMLAGIVVEVLLGGHPDYLLYLTAGGLQLFTYVLLLMLIFFVQILVNQKFTGMLVSLIAYGLILFAANLGLEHP